MRELGDPPIERKKQGGGKRRIVPELASFFWGGDVTSVSKHVCGTAC